MKLLEVVIPGPPCAQGRGRAVRFGNSVRVIDPQKSKSWKGAAQVHMLKARGEAGLSTPYPGPLCLDIRAYFPFPKSKSKKKNPVPIRWQTSRPDIDNICKAVMDAGNGILWQDDSQVVYLIGLKKVVAQGGTPEVRIVMQEVAIA